MPEFWPVFWTVAYAAASLFALIAGVGVCAGICMLVAIERAPEPRKGTLREFVEWSFLVACVLGLVLVGAKLIS